MFLRTMLGVLLLGGCSSAVDTVEAQPKALKLVLTWRDHFGQREAERAKARTSVVTVAVKDGAGRPAKVDKPPVVSSSAPDVATATAVAKADGYEVTIVGASPGKAAIKVAFGEKAATVDVEVVEALSLNLKPLSATVVVGTRQTIVAAVQAKDGSDLDVPVRWRSANEEVVSVESGVITGKSPGTTEVTAAVGALEASVTVVVAAPALRAFLDLLEHGKERAVTLKTSSLEVSSLRIEAERFVYRRNPDQPKRTCEGRLTVEGDHISGRCAWTRPPACLTYGEDDLPCPSIEEEVSFRMTLREVTAEGHVAYDLHLDQVQKGYQDSLDEEHVDLENHCWKSAKGGSSECTARAIHAPWTAPSQEALTRLVKRGAKILLANQATVSLRFAGAKPVFTFDGEPCDEAPLRILEDGLEGTTSCRDEERDERSDRSFSMKVRSVAETAAIYKSCLGATCTEREWCWVAARSFDDAIDVCPDPDLGILPSATDRTLFEKARRQLQSANKADWKAAGLDGLPMLFEGPPAKNPRTTSEIYYVGERKQDALAAAKLLGPVLGPIAPKPWPGADFAVTVVVGDQVAGKRPTP